MTSSDERSPIAIYKPHGDSNDEIDALKFWDAFEDPCRWEQAMKIAHQEAKGDPELANVLKSAYLQENRAEAFETYFGSPIPQAVAKLFARFGINDQSEIVDLGCGAGHCAHALHRLGFKRISAMDPNSEWFTGTGYLKSIAGDAINIINDLEVWRRTIARYDAVVSSGTIHHWRHIPMVALDARRAMKPGAFWIALSEFTAPTSRDLALLLKNHPTASRYKSYEWPYPASAYVDLIQSVGFNLVAVIPHFYDKNSLIGWTRPIPKDLDVDELYRSTSDNLAKPYGTVEMFWREVDSLRRGTIGSYLFTDPQALIFQRVAPEQGIFGC
jgi:2-polyprenyl-3-methyl-5-hydroxy-6-metoxy-1,4-benzoquinol methylase